TSPSPGFPSGSSSDSSSSSEIKGRVNTSASSGVSPECSVFSSSGVCSSKSDLQKLVFLVAEEAVDLLHVAIGQLLQLVFAPSDVVVGDLAVHRLHVRFGVATDVSDCAPTLLGPVPQHFDQI